MTPALLARLKADEGLRLFPYTDTVGKLTIGYGRNLSDKGISQIEAEYLLENDLEAAERDCQAFPWFAGLSEARQIVIVSMVFNLGLVGFQKFHHLIAAMQRMDYDTASEEMLRSKWADQVKGRAVRLAQMMQQG